MVRLTFVFVAVGLGILAGWMAEKREFGGSEVFVEGNYRPSVSADVAKAAQAAKDVVAPPNLVVVNGAEHHFGQMMRWAESSHVFVLANQSDRPLKLTKGESSCTCTLVNFEEGEATLAPGESIDIELNWTVKTLTSSEFRQTAEIKFNDVDRPSDVHIVRLIIRGHVNESIQVTPAEISFGNVLSTRPLSKIAYLLNPNGKELEVSGHRFLNEETASFFDVAFESLTSDELQQMIPVPMAGVRATVTMLPGLPSGDFGNTVVFEIAGGKSVGVEVPISGHAISEVSVIGGPMFRSDRNALLWDNVSQSKGISERLAVVIKGELRDQVQLEIGDVFPADVLKVELGEPKPSAKSIVVPLVVTIPPNSRTINCMGGPNRLAEIILKTTHPATKEIKIILRFAVR